MREIKLVPRTKENWVGKKYEDAILVGLGRDKNLILLVKGKDKKRQMTRTSWTPHFWKVSFLIPKP